LKCRSDRQKKTQKFFFLNMSIFSSNDSIIWLLCFRMSILRTSRNKWLFSFAHFVHRHRLVKVSIIFSIFWRKFARFVFWTIFCIRSWTLIYLVQSFFCRVLRIFADFTCILIASLINRVTFRMFFTSFSDLFIMSFVNMISKFFFSTTLIMMTMNSRVYRFLSELETVFFAIFIIDVKICTRSIILRIIFE
jgi:hypothetical protein